MHWPFLGINHFHVNWVISVKICLWIWLCLAKGVQYDYVFENIFVDRIRDISLQERNMNPSAIILSNIVTNYLKMEFLFSIIIKCLGFEKKWYSSTPRNDMICKVCNRNNVVDQYHFLLMCDCYVDLRYNYLP